MLFSLKLQRDNRKNALAVDPARGKLEKRLYFSLHCGDETTTYYNRAFEIFKTYCNNVFFNKIGCVIENG